MVSIQLAKNAKTIHVIADAVDKKKAQETAEAHKSSAFGMVSNVMKMFDSKRGEIELVGYRKRYDPFWHIAGESFFEYRRKSTYQFGVRPEVQSVTIQKHTLKTQSEAPLCIFEGVDHCYEHYTKELIQDALAEKGKDYKKYLESKAKTIKKVEDLQREDTVVMPVEIRASFLLHNLYKEIIKPIHADEILDQRVVINKLALMLTPTHIFEFSEGAKGTHATIEVDGVTGEWRKGTRLIADLTKKYWSADTLFDISTELAGTLLPGAGVGMVLTKKLFDRRKENKTATQHQQLHAEFSGKKRR